MTPADDDKTAFTPREGSAAGNGAGTNFPPTHFAPTAPVERTEMMAPPVQARNADLGNVLPVGTRVREFEITGLLGEGGFGIVYLAYDTGTQRRVALKEYMPTSLAARTEGGIQVKSERYRETFDAGMKSFVNEARLLAQFDHPSLVRVYQFWEGNGTAYMVMPFYEGKNLRDTLRERLAATGQPPDEGWLRTLLVPLTEALRVIHAEKCYHRDIAPDNVMMLGGAQRPLLLDFGAARRVIGDMTQALTVILKPGYAPIEQYAEIPGMRQGPWTDVYALAAVVYFAITGKTPPVSVGRMLSDSYQPLAQVAAGRYTPRFLEAVDRALVVRPEQRTQNIDAFREDLGLMEPMGLPAGGTLLMPQEPDDRTRIAPQTMARGATQQVPTQVPTQVRPQPMPQGLVTQLPTQVQPLPPPAPVAPTRMGGAPADEPTRMAPPRRPQAATPEPVRAAQDQGGGRRGLMLALAGVGVVALGAGGFFAMRPSGPAPAPSLPPAPPTEPAAGPSVAPTTPPAAPATPPPPPPVFDAVREFDKAVQAQTPGFGVRAEPVKTSLSVAAKEEIKFRVTSDRDGFLYVVGFGTDGTFALLVPNKLSGPVRVRRGQRVDFPRTDGVYLPVSEPLGATHLLVMVSAELRDFASLQPRAQDPFMLLPTGSTATALLARHRGAQPLLAGDVRCAAGAACSTDYGAALLRFETVR